jgi:chromosome segregation ATPase
MVLLDQTIEHKLSSLENQVAVLTSAKELLEGEVSTLNVERSLLGADLANISSEHEALKAAYHALETETMNAAASSLAAEKKRAKEKEAAAATTAAPAIEVDISGLTVKITSLEKQLNASNDMCERLQSELATAARRMMQYDKMPSTVRELEAKLRVLEDAKSRLDSELLQKTEECDSYRQLTETLKEKIRNLSSPDQRDFLDSFEEVMRDEMYAMKKAFEMKLKIAKDEADQASRRHYNQIQQMQTDGTGGAHSQTLGRRF